MLLGHFSRNKQKHKKYDLWKETRRSEETNEEEGKKGERKHKKEKTKARKTSGHG